MTLPQLVQLGDLNLLWLTMWAEGRGDSAEGHSSVEERIAIGCVIRNRVKAVNRFDNSYVHVCLAPRQFSCWGTLGGEMNNKTLMTLAQQVFDLAVPISDPLCLETLYLAQGIIGGQLLDRTGGSLFYVTAALAASPSAPAWVHGVPVADRLAIGSQVFMKNA